MYTPYGHLTYCTNIHTGESWNDHFANLQRHIPAVKKAVAPHQPYGIGLRLSNLASLELEEEENLSAFQQWLHQNDCYVYTLNGFPYGGFHNTRVKDGVHAPDWKTDERVQYTIRLAHLLAALLPEGMEGGISTSPLTYKDWYATEDSKQALLQMGTEHVLQVAEELIRIQQATGKIIHLDIEPEPDGMLADGPEFLEWYQQYLLPMGISFLQKQYGFLKEQAETSLKTHIQLCYDICHFAISYVDHAGFIQQLHQYGIKTGKIQISAALKSHLSGDFQQRKKVIDAFRHFDEPTYLHQVVARLSDGTLKRYADLPQALADAENPLAQEWRAHFHVPLFAEDYGLLQSTQKDIAQVLAIHQQQPFTAHLEIETYTWEVLPDNLKLPLQASIIRELQWVIRLLQP